MRIVSLYQQDGMAAVKLDTIRKQHKCVLSGNMTSGFLGRETQVSQPRPKHFSANLAKHFKWSYFQFVRSPCQNVPKQA
jgi:hypothetical protein